MKTIHLNPYDYVKVDERGLLAINGNTYYNPKYYNFKASNGTQQRIIQQAKPELSLKNELKQLTNIDRLKKKLNYYFNHRDKLKYLSDDDRIIKQRNLNKSKKTIQKYLNSLRQDNNFKIERLENALKLCYEGKFVTSYRVVVL